MGSRSDWIANRLAGARRWLSAIEQEIAQAQDLDTSSLREGRRFLELELGYLLNEAEIKNSGDTE
jgi:hypothetical protein